MDEFRNGEMDEFMGNESFFRGCCTINTVKTNKLCGKLRFMLLMGNNGNECFLFTRYKHLCGFYDKRETKKTRHMLNP